MKVCFPVMESRGLESKIYGHFGTAKENIELMERELLREVTPEDVCGGHGTGCGHH